MRILFLADGRSPIALNWLSGMLRLGHEVHLVSSFPCQPALAFHSFKVIPLAFSSLKAAPALQNQQPPPSGLRSKPPLRSTAHARTKLRQWLGPLTLPAAAKALAAWIQQVQPDLVHALRIPYEGMAAGLAYRLLPAQERPPLVISVWGNDFTLHAPANPWMAHLTRLALAQASALHTDCRRDLRQAYAWGFAAGRPAITLPGNGGIDTSLFHPLDASPAPEPLVVNPRGIRAYVRNDTFFKSIPLVLEQFPTARFACPGMIAESQAQRWVEEFNIGGQVELLPLQSKAQMAALFQRAAVTVSPSTHDGTPNTLLEAMACGCFPVAGDLESLREWITPGVNGYLFDPADPVSLAQAVTLALENPLLRQRAAQENARRIAQRAEFHQGIQRAQDFFIRCASK